MTKTQTGGAGTEALADVVALLNAAGATPTSLGFAHILEPYLSMTFASLADIQAFADADKIKLKVSDKSSRGGFVADHYASYKRPGRSMLIQYIQTGEAARKALEASA